MNSPQPVKGLDKLVLNTLFIGFLIWVSFIFNNKNGDPGYAIRHVGISLFCTSYIFYFLILRKVGVLTFTKLQLAGIVAYVLFTLVGFLSALIGINPTEGIFTTLINLNFIILVGITVHAHRIGLDVRVVAFAITLIGVITGLFGVLQYYDLVPKNLIAGAPPTALQFNRNFFGSAQVLVLPFAIISLLGTTGFKKHISLAALLIVVMSISISQTRSAILSLLVFTLVIILGIITYYRKNRLSKRVNIYIWSGIILMTIGGALLAVTNFDNISKSVTRHLNSENPFRRQSSIEERLTIWEGSYEIFKENPLIGVGFGNWKIHYAGNESQTYRAKTGRAVVAKAHNVYLEFLGEVGLVGFTFYLIYIFIVLWLLVRQGVGSKFGYILGAGFLAFLSDHFFSFGNYQPTHMLYSGLMIGYILYLDSSAEKENNYRIPQGLVILVCLLCTMACYWTFSFMIFEQSIEKSQESSLNNDFATAHYHLDNAVNSVHNLNRQGDSPHLQKAMIHNRNREYEEAISELNLAWRDHPLSPRLNATFATSYFSMGDLEKASLYYQKALNIQSANIKIAEKLAVCYFELEEFEKCYSTLKPFENRLEKNLQFMLKISGMRSGKALPRSN